MRALLLPVLLLLTACIALPPSPTAGAGTPLDRGIRSFFLTSPAFGPARPIPAGYTCDGRNASPPLAWSGLLAPAGSFALLMDDIDTPGPFTHWVLFNLPPDLHELPEGMPLDAELGGGAIQGRNDAGATGYAAPCPPSGQRHHYRFLLYALDAPVPAGTAPTRAGLLTAIQGHVIGEALLLGEYRRPSP